MLRPRWEVIRLGVRRVDAKGRVYLSRRVVGSELYAAEVEGVFLLSPPLGSASSQPSRGSPRGAR